MFTLFLVTINDFPQTETETNAPVTLFVKFVCPVETMQSLRQAAKKKIRPDNPEKNFFFGAQKKYERKDDH